MGLVRREKTILVGTMDEKLVCFNTKGKVIWQQKMPANIVCMQLMEVPSRGGQFVAVALANKQILIFNDKHIVDCLT